MLVLHHQQHLFLFFEDNCVIVQVYENLVKAEFHNQSITQCCGIPVKKKILRYLNNIKLLLFLNLMPCLFLLWFLSCGSLVCHAESKRKVVLIRIPCHGFFNGNSLSV